MPMVIEALHYLGLDYLVNPQKRLYWGYLLSSALIMILYFLLTRQSVARLFSKDLWWHPSARLDYIYFLVVSLIKIGLLLPWMLGVRETSIWTLRFMESLFGYQAKIAVDHQWLVLGYTLALFLLSDLSRYCLHRLMHSVPFLWAFHQVHHSAEVLTPVTFYRVHPVENILFGLRYALVAGLITGVFIYCFGANLALMDVIGVNLFVFVFHILGDNLRHSPVHFRYFNLVEKWFISPAQHQYHHTVQGGTVNYGGVLSIWDRLFGSLRCSVRQDHYHYGLGDEGKVFRSVGQLLLQPFSYFIRPFQIKSTRSRL